MQSTAKTPARRGGGRAIVLILGLIAATLTAVVSVAAPAQAATGNIPPPFNIGETWNICQGYGGSVSHTGTSLYGLDLTGAGCNNSAAGRQAIAPVTGTVAYYQAAYGNLCINIAGGKSYTLTHINSTVTGSVTAGQIVGTVAAAGQRGNNNLAHIHFQMWSSSGCYNNSVMPFDTAHGARICGAPDLTPGGAGGQGAWSGTSFTGATCGGGSTPPPAPPHAMKGNYNGDLYSDLGILHQTGDGGMDAHVLWGSSGTPFGYNPTFTRSLPASAGWDWSKVKTAAGDFNNDSFEDIALVHQLADDSADVHVLWGSSGTPFGYNPTFTRHLDVSNGWHWSQMKLVAGKFNPDSFSDLAILRKAGDGGIDAHILYGSTGTPFQYNPTLARSLPASDGWDWDKIKATSGFYNDDPYEDVALFAQRTDGGADVHVLWGSVGIPFGYSGTFARSLPGSDGWSWAKMKLASGRFNLGTFSDVVILHETSGGGFDAHILYGSTGAPFQYNPTFARSFPGSAGWDWSGIKQTSGDFNNDGFDDVALVHKLGDDGAHIHVLWGSTGTPFGYNPTFTRELPASAGWRWTQMNVVP